MNALRQSSTLLRVSKVSGVPLYRVRSAMRELPDAGLAAAEGEIYAATGKGRAKPEERYSNNRRLKK